jgi:hypothetical protein
MTILWLCGHTDRKSVALKWRFSPKNHDFCEKVERMSADLLLICATGVYDSV